MNTYTQLALIAIMAGISCSPLIAERIEETLQHTFALSEASEIFIEAEDASVVIVGSDTETTDVTIERIVEGVSKAEGKAILEDRKTKLSEYPKKLVIVSPERGKSFQWNKAAHYHETITIRSPYDTSFEIESEDGNVNIADIQSDIAIEAEDGNVNSEGLSGFLQADLEDGNLKCERFEGSFQVKLEDGNVRIEMLGTPEQACTAKTDDGNIKLRFAKDSSVLIEAKTKDGDIRSDFGSMKRVASDDGQSAQIQINDGATLILLKSDDGNILIE